MFACQHVRLMLGSITRFLTISLHDSDDGRALVHKTEEVRLSLASRLGRRPVAAAT